ncbi:MAG: 50S rRNA methyltransferase [Spirochaetes bacterium]|nr:MAG: 50S rRNA methyltransferase [Spirochaetota bacterium]
MKKVTDYYAKLAKKMGYPARSVFKLEEIQNKYHIIKKEDAILDIGAFPGSWSLYMLKKLHVKGKIVGIDLKNTGGLKKYSNYTYIQGDITEEKTINLLKNYGPFNVIISDAAPSTSGNKDLDSLRSLELVRAVVNLAYKALKEGGNLLIKLFMSEDASNYLVKTRELFLKTKNFKPKSSRSESREIFFIGFNFKRLNKKNT